MSDHHIHSSQDVASSEDSGSQDSDRSSSKDVSSSDASDPNYVGGQAATDAADSESDELDDLADEESDQDRPGRSKPQQQQQQRRKQSAVHSNTRTQPLHDTAAAGAAAAASGASTNEGAAADGATTEHVAGSGMQPAAGAAPSCPIVARSRAALNSRNMNLSARLFPNIAQSETVPIKVSYVLPGSTGAATPAAAAAAGVQGSCIETGHTSQRLGQYSATVKQYGAAQRGGSFQIRLGGVRDSGELAPYLNSHAGQEQFVVVLQEQVGPSELVLHLQPVQDAATLSNDNAPEIRTADATSAPVKSTLSRRNKHGMMLILPAAVTASHFSHVRSGAPCPVLVRTLDGSFAALDAQGASQPQQWFAGEVQFRQRTAPRLDQTVVVVNTASQPGAAQYVGRSVCMISAEAASAHSKLTLHLETPGAPAAAPTQQQQQQTLAGGSSATRQLAAEAAEAAGKCTASAQGGPLQPAGAVSDSRGRSTSHHAQPSRQAASEGGRSPAVPAGQPPAPGVNAPGSSTEPAPLSAHRGMQLQRALPRADAAGGRAAALLAQEQAGSRQRRRRNEASGHRQQAGGARAQQSGQRVTSCVAASPTCIVPAPAAASPRQLGGSNSDRQQAACAGLLPVQPAGGGEVAGEMSARAAGALGDAAAEVAAPGQAGRRKQRQVPAAAAAAAAAVAAGPEWVCDLTADSNDEVAVKQEPRGEDRVGSTLPAGAAAAAAAPQAPAATATAAAAAVAVPAAAAAAAAAAGQAAAVPAAAGRLRTGLQLLPCDSPVQMTEQLQQLLELDLAALLPVEQRSSMLMRLQERMRPFRRGEVAGSADWKWLLTDYRCVQVAVAAGQLQGG